MKASGNNPGLLQKVRQIEKLRISYEMGLRSLSRSQLEQLTNGLKVLPQLKALFDACLQAGVIIAQPEEDPHNVKAWLSYYIEDVIRLLPLPLVSRNPSPRLMRPPDGNS